MLYWHYCPLNWGDSLNRLDLITWEQSFPQLVTEEELEIWSMRGIQSHVVGFKMEGTICQGMGKLPGTKSKPWLTAGEQMGNSLIQPQGIEFFQQEWSSKQISSPLPIFQMKTQPGGYLISASWYLDLRTQSCRAGLLLYRRWTQTWVLF